MNYILHNGVHIRHFGQYSGIEGINFAAREEAVDFRLQPTVASRIRNDEVKEAAKNS